MNCLEFRRFYTEDPSNKSKKIKEHMQSCSACQTFSLQADEFEIKLMKTVNVNIPQNMEERIVSAINISDKEE